MSSRPSSLLPQIPVDEAELRTALHSVAIPGYTGSLYVEIGFRSEEDPISHQVRYYPVIEIRRREVHQGRGDGQRQILPDVERRTPVETVLGSIRSRMIIRPVLRAVEFNFRDGVVTGFTVQE